ncbi:hypothetical protein ACFXKG_32650 [Streptomyces sp. NPDC059255]|uniref:hypothetical protein n=1 Tax=Streptomyces sp. NPDC059255 TaxID=3346793 RepID=UPI00369B63CB
MTMEIARDMTMLAVAVRVFGKDAVMLLRWGAAAGVRAGISEMNRRTNGKDGR